MIKAVAIATVCLVGLIAFILVRFGWTQGNGDQAVAPIQNEWEPGAIGFCVDAIGLNDDFEALALDRVAATGELGPNGDTPVAGCPAPVLLNGSPDDGRGFQIPYG